MSFILLAIGFVLLIKGADILIDSSARLAHLLSVPAFIIGFSVIAFGTSAPELAIGILSGIRQENLITLGDVIGSCIANIALIIGITALIHPLDIPKSVLYRDIPLAFGIQLLLTVLLLTDGKLSRMDAVLLLILFCCFLFYLFRRSKELGKVQIEENDIDTAVRAVPGLAMEEKKEGEELLEAAAEIHAADRMEPAQTKEHSPIKLAVMMLISLAAIAGGGELIVESSTGIARMFGLSDVLIGATIVAIGTSLPELVTSVLAALKKQSDIAVGNIIGSNIFNVLSVLGISAFIHPIPAEKGIGMDLLFMLGAALLIFLLPLRKGKVGRMGGLVLLVFYVLFLACKVLTA